LGARRALEKLSTSHDGPRALANLGPSGVRACPITAFDPKAANQLATFSCL
jgi:hypothetical protein